MRCWTSQDECRCTHAAAAFSFAPSVPFPLSFARSVLLFCFVRQDCYTSTLSPRSAATPATRHALAAGMHPAAQPHVCPGLVSLNQC